MIKSMQYAILAFKEIYRQRLAQRPNDIRWLVDHLNGVCGCPS